MSLLKIVVIGDGGVGKSALIIQLTQNIFEKDYDPTIEQSYRKQVEVNDKKFMLDILDTAGNEQYSVMKDRYLRSGQGFILVYSIIDKKSFDELDELLKKVKLTKESDFVPVVIVGNKCDLEDRRQVSYQDGEEIANRNNGVFFETSAKCRINVLDIFTSIVVELEKKLLTETSFVSPNRKKHKDCLIS